MSELDYYSEAAHGPHEVFELGNYQLESGITLPNARIAYKTHGTLNAAKDNVVLFPHMWSGTPKAMETFIGEDRPLNPRKYFIILPGQFANGFSSSPSNTPPPETPRFTGAEPVRCPHCHAPLLLPLDLSTEVVCPGCGGSFRLQETQATTTAEMRLLGRFQVLEQVGMGSFGAVWRARDPELDRLVALKMLHPGLVSSAADRERFIWSSGQQKNGKSVNHDEIPVQGPFPRHR